MEIGKTGNAAGDYRQISSAQQKPPPSPKEEAEQQTVDSAAGAQTVLLETVAPNGQTAAGNGGASNQPPKTAEAAAAAQQSSAVQALTTQSSEEDDDATYQAIVAKADSGQRLTASELSTLRAKDPARYSRAVQAQTARQSLRAEMEKSPSNANKAAKEAIAALQAGGESLAQAHSPQSAESVDTLVKALNDEYNSFARQYDQVMFTMPAAEE